MNKKILLAGLCGVLALVSCHNHKEHNHSDGEHTEEVGTEATNKKGHSHGGETTLLHTTLDLLYKAVEGGEITVMEYYVEADAFYKNLQAHMQLENQCQKILAEITKNEI